MTHWKNTPAGERSESPGYPASTIAKLLMVSIRQLQLLTKEGVIPRAARGRYELAPAVQAYIRHVHSRFTAADRDNVSHAEVANHLFMDRSRVGDLVAKGVLPRTGRGLNLDQCRAAYFKHLREVAAGRGGEGGVLDLAAERARKAKEEADRLEMQNAQMREDLLERADVEAGVAAAFSRVRTKLVALPAKLAPIVAAISEPRGAEAALREVVYAALDELADTTVEDVARDNGFVLDDVPGGGETGPGGHVRG